MTKRKRFDAVARTSAIAVFEDELKTRSDGYVEHLAHGGKADCGEEFYLDALYMAISALREQGGSFQNGNNHNMVKDWPSYMDLPRERNVTGINAGCKWISVSDRLPNDTEKVLVYTTTGNTTVARWSQRQEKFVASGHITVTHWMSLPEKPEEEV